MFKVNIKNIRTISLTSFYVFIINLEHISLPFSGAFIVDFKKVNVNWEVHWIRSHWIQNFFSILVTKYFSIMEYFSRFQNIFLSFKFFFSISFFFLTLKYFYGFQIFFLDSESFFSIMKAFSRFWKIFLDGGYRPPMVSDLCSETKGSRFESGC